MYIRLVSIRMWAFFETLHNYEVLTTNLYTWTIENFKMKASFETLQNYRVLTTNLHIRIIEHFQIKAFFEILQNYSVLTNNLHTWIIEQKKSTHGLLNIFTWISHINHWTSSIMAHINHKIKRDTMIYVVNPV